MVKLSSAEYDSIMKKIEKGMSIRAATKTEKKRYAFRAMCKKKEAGTQSALVDGVPVLKNPKVSEQESLFETPPLEKPPFLYNSILSESQPLQEISQETQQETAQEMPQEVSQENLIQQEAPPENSTLLEHPVQIEQSANDRVEPVPPEEVEPTPEDVTAEELLKVAKVALYREMKSGSPLPAYIKLVFQLCEATLPEWSTNKQAHKEGVEEYKAILADLVNDPIKSFEIVAGGKEPERKVANG